MNDFISSGTVGKYVQLPPPPVKKILNSKDHSYNKWTRILLHQNPYLKTEKHKRESNPIQIVETGRNTQPSFKTKPNHNVNV
jgi:hypothetical protein